MRAHATTFLLSLAACTATTFAAPDSAWQNVVVGDAATPNVPGVKGAVFVPFEFSNPVIDTTGKMTFRGRIAGPGIDYTNSRMIVSGTPGALSAIARDGAPVPGNNPKGYVFNTIDGFSGVTSSTTISASGGYALPAFINGPGVTEVTGSAFFFISPSGAPSLIAREGDACPGTAGAKMLASLGSAYGQQFNDSGQALLYTPLDGGDTDLTNDAALVLVGATGDQLVLRKGAAAPGFADGTTITPSQYGFTLNGTKLACTATLVNEASINSTNDDAALTNIGAAGGALRIFAREGAAIPGTGGLTFAAGEGTPYLAQHAIEADGTILFTASLGGAATAVDNAAVMTERNGAYAILLRKGDSVPGVTDSTNATFAGKRFQGVNVTAFARNRNGLLAYQGILMNADGSAILYPGVATYIGARRADGTVVTICRESDPVPGSPGWQFSSLNGYTGLCVGDNGVVVFNADIHSGDTMGSTTMAWDAVNGLRVLARTGDTNFTGTPCNMMFLIGSTGNNGNGGHTGLSANGWLALTVYDTDAGIQTLARIRLDATAPCPADLNHSGAVDASDLAILLGAWGGTGGDVNADGATNASDLAVMLGAWGACP